MTTNGGMCLRDAIEVFDQAKADESDRLTAEARWLALAITGELERRGVDVRLGYRWLGAVERSRRGTGGVMPGAWVEVARPSVGLATGAHILFASGGAWIGYPADAGVGVLDIPAADLLAWLEAAAGR